MSETDIEYYTLLIYNEMIGKWESISGSHDVEEIRFEAEAEANSGPCLIIVTAEDAVYAAVNQINGV